MDLLASPQILNGRRFNYPICINIKSSEQIKRLSISYHYPNRCMCTRNFVIRHSPICHYICLLSIFNVRPLRSPWCARALGVAVRHRLAAGRERPGPRSQRRAWGTLWIWIPSLDRVAAAAGGGGNALRLCNLPQLSGRPPSDGSVGGAGGRGGSAGGRREGR